MDRKTLRLQPSLGLYGTGLDYFKSDQSEIRPDLGTRILPEPEPEPDLGRPCFELQNNTVDETNGVNNAVRCYKEAVQFSVSFVMSMFVSFDKICRTAMNFVFFHPDNTN